MSILFGNLTSGFAEPSNKSAHLSFETSHGFNGFGVNRLLADSAD